MRTQARLRPEFTLDLAVDGVQRLKGSFHPHPNVWTGFVALIAFVYGAAFTGQGLSAPEMHALLTLRREPSAPSASTVRPSRACG